MSLLLLLSAQCPPEDPDGVGTGALADGAWNLEAALDAIFKEDDRIGGRAVTRLRSTLEPDEINCMDVESTIGFGELADGTGDGRLLVGGEVIDFAGRNSNDPFLFSDLTRSVESTEATRHPPGTLVFDLSRNTSAIDLVRRGLMVDTAVGEDLEVIQRNLGLRRCRGVTEEQLRRIIKAVAYLPKQTIPAFRDALLALWDDPALFVVYELLVTRPWTVFVEIDTPPATDIRGRFTLNSGEPQLTTGVSTVDTSYDVLESTLAAYPGAATRVLGGRTYTYPAGAAGSRPFSVYDDTPLTRRGYRDGFTDYAAGGSVVGNTITLGSSPGPLGTPVLVDYAAFTAHYTAYDEAVRQDLAQADRWAYLADPLLATKCLLDQIRAAGIRVEVSAKL